jgi:CheY-like chemotaxis protein/HPt (histidine-containing phosphotransfer) domain-containing protein
MCGTALEASGQRVDGARDGAGVHPARDARALVVDDDPVNRMVMGAILRQLGYRFDVAVNGREAVEAVRREPYAIVLMDCLMPEMDGYEATARIRSLERGGLAQHARETAARRRRLPIVAVTAVAVEGARERCLAAGMDDYLAKPIVTRGVAEMLDRWVADDEEASAPAPSAVPEPDASDDAPIDGRVLDELREIAPDDPGAGNALIAELADDFAQEVGARIAMLRGAVAADDVLAVREALHFIVGCAAVLGARHVERLARSLHSGVDLSDAANRGREMAVLVGRLDAAFTNACTALSAVAAPSTTEV